MQALGRPLPTSNFDRVASFFWHLLRQVLHYIYVGRWLAKKAGGLWNKVGADDVKKSARDAAYAYHRLHQLHLTGESGNPLGPGPTILGFIQIDIRILDDKIPHESNFHAITTLLLESKNILCGKEL